MKVVNLYAGPGTGKSTTAAALFAEMKYRGWNVEYVPEYAKWATWERRGEKVFAAQEYIFAKQSFSLSRVADEVDFVITDSPLLLSLVYNETIKALPALVLETYNKYENLNIFLVRNKPYNPKGRNQTEEQAKELDSRIREMLIQQNIEHTALQFGRENVDDIARMIYLKWYRPKGNSD